MINPFFKIRFSLGGFYWKQALLVQKFIAVLFAVLMIAVILAVGWFSYQSFIFLKGDDYGNAQLVVYALYIGLTLLFMLFVLGSAITTTSLAYQSQDLLFFMSLPVSSDLMIREKVIESIIISGWGVIALGGPAMISFGLAMNGGFIYYLVALLSLILLCFLAGAFGSIIVIAGSFLLRSANNLTKKLVVAAASIVWLFAMAAAILPNVDRIDQAVSNGINPGLAIFAGPFSRLFPSYYISELIGWSVGGVATITAIFGVLIYFLILWYALRFVSTNYYRSGLQSTIQRAVGPFPKRASGWFKNRRYILEQKEAIQIWRELRAAPQLVFTSILLIFYLLVLLSVSRAQPSGHWSGFFFGSLLGVAGYVIATIILRFIFPIMSFEGQSGWLLWSCPVSLGHILKAKWVVGLTFAILLGLLVGGISASIIPFSLFMKLIFFFYVLLISLLIGLLQLGIGMSYPDFHETDPSMLSNSGPGLAAIILSLIVSSLGAWFTYQDVLLIGHSGWFFLILFHLASFIGLIAIIGIIWFKKVYEMAKGFTF